MKTSGTGAAKVAREIALDIAQDVYRPTLVQHIPGVSNVAADSLSRLEMPGSQYSIPAFLSEVSREGLDKIVLFRVRF